MDTEDIKKENEHLKSINAVKSDLISISSHQLRTSLSALKWMIKMFQDKDLGPLSNEQGEFLSKMSDSNERMIKLVNNMLTLNHAEDTALKFDIQTTDIKELLDETIFEFLGESHKKSIELVYINKDSKVPDIKCDKEMVRVVLQNLVENAIKYSDPNDKVFISTKLADNMLEISVHDTGIGINEMDKGHIFDKFYRADNAKDKDSVGSGLGLFTAKKIIEYHHGRMWFESEKDMGTTFFIALPTNTSVV